MARYLLWSTGMTHSFSVPSARLIHEKHDSILKEWVSSVKSEISSAMKLDAPFIVNTLPVFLDNLAEALQSGSSCSVSSSPTNVAEEHGGERARVTDYEPSQVVQEYILLRNIIFKTLGDSGEVNFRDTALIYAFFDEAIQKAMQAYYVIWNSMRARFLNHLTHDIGTPLTSAKLSLELILRELSREPLNSDKVGSHCHVALKGIGYANDLIEQMLNADHFRPKETTIVPEFDQIDIMQIASTCIVEMNSLTNNRVNLSGEFVLGYWDGKALRRVLENLIANAVKYGDDASPISVKVSSCNGRMLMSVHNFGNPIPADKRSIIFSSRKRLVGEKDVKGWGLGLEYCRKAAAEHAGSIGIVSDQKNGTTFTIDLPMDPRGKEISKSSY